MKRFDFEAREQYEEGEYVATAVECPTGDFVRFDIAAKLVAALETSRAEFATLKVRLPEPYATNAAKCCALIDETLKATKGDA